MTQVALLTTLKDYQRNSKLQGVYLRQFTPKMVYSTTKAEHPMLKKTLVDTILRK